jgi:hypothetical protein
MFEQSRNMIKNVVLYFSKPRHRPSRSRRCRSSSRLRRSLQWLVPTLPAQQPAGWANHLPGDGGGEAEAESEVAAARPDEAAKRHAAAPGVEVPAAAATHAVDA